jgi:hypothetical protein
VRLAAILASLLVASTAFAQTAAPAPAAEPAAPAAAAPAAAPAPAPAPESPFKFALHGFVSMSAAYQTGSFILSEGQQSLGSSTAANAQDKNSLTFDVRQTRLNFSVTGPKVLAGATPSGVVELDFMQGFGGGNYGDVSLLNRLRLAYAELNWGNHRLQFGQNNDLVFALAPTSLSHIAFPLGYYTGNIGWRRPGVFGYHTFSSGDVKVEGAWEVGRSQWADAASNTCTVAAAPASVPPQTYTCTNSVTIGGAAAAPSGGISLGEASGAPAVEGRVTFAYAKYLTAFVAAHWNQVDLSGYNNSIAIASTAKSTIDVAAYNAGVKLTVPFANDMGLTVQGTGFTGKNVAPLIANLTTAASAFNLGPNNADVKTTGYWAQAGLNFTKELSLWAFYGAQVIDHSDLAQRAGAVDVAYENATTNVLAMYRDGGFGFSAEWIGFATKYSGANTSAANGIQNSRTANSSQVIGTANYFF